MLNAVVVFIGGGVGAFARYSMQGIIYRWIGTAFPYGTLAVNVIGCFLIGLFMIVFEDRFLVNPTLRIFLTVGILGGFTTFSTFSYETISMLRDGEIYFAFANILVSLVGCLGGTYLGMTAGKLI
jgi:CrcB protein